MNDICEEAIAYKEDPQYRNFINLYCKEIVTYQFEQGNYEEALSYYLMHAEFIEMILNDEFSVEELEFIVEIFDNIVICCDKLKQYSLKLKYAWRALTIYERLFTLLDLTWNDLFDNPHFLPTNDVINSILQLDLPLNGTKEDLKKIDPYEQREMPTKCFLKICEAIKEYI